MVCRANLHDHSLVSYNWSFKEDKVLLWLSVSVLLEEPEQVALTKNL